jgi:hypothetical protein
MDYSYVTSEYVVKQFKELENENKKLKCNITELKHKLCEQKVINEFHEYRLSTNEKNISDLNNNLMNYLAYGKPLTNDLVYGKCPSKIPSSIENFAVPKQVFTEVNPIQPIQPSVGLFKTDDKNPFSFKTF